MIASVDFKNFKALRATALQLAPFNLIIGANGSGKTSLIQAVERLHALARLPLATPGPARRAGGPRISFRFNSPFAAVEARLECVSEASCDLLQIRPAHAPEWPALQAQLGRIRSYQLDYGAMTAPVAPGASPDAPLSPSGANLAAVLAAWRDRHPAEFAALVAEVLRVLPEYSGLELVRGPAGIVTLGLRLGPGGDLVTADNLSQGTLALLAILALAHDPAPPAVLCIEEIDRGVHPRRLREVRDAFYRLSHPSASGLKRPAVQVIATTHSPYLLDLFRDHPEEIVIAQKQGRAARFERLADRADLAELLLEGSLGDMWYSGILGGVPDES